MLLRHELLDLIVGAENLWQPCHKLLKFHSKDGAAVSETSQELVCNYDSYISLTILALHEKIPLYSNWVYVYTCGSKVLDLTSDINPTIQLLINIQ